MENAVSRRCFLCSFFFQAEDGIRDVAVTGVQTCALPILQRGGRGPHRPAAGGGAERPTRSEERRVGKSVDLGGRRIIKKKKKKKQKKTQSRRLERDKYVRTRRSVTKL